MQEKLTVVSAFQEYMILDKELIVFMCLFLEVASEIFGSRWGYRLPLCAKVEHYYKPVIGRNGVE